MNTRLWVLNPLLLATTLPVFSTQAAEENLIVSANRTHRTVAEMAQTTWVIEGHEIEQQVQGGNAEEDQRRYTDHGHRQIEDPAEDETGAGLP